MKKGNTLVVAVIYEGVKQYLSEYFNAINNQDTDCFNILLLIDNVKYLKLPNTSIDCKEIVFNKKRSPARIRSDAISYARDNHYEYLIFSDMDDFFSTNRISASVENLQKNDFVFNELDLVDQDSQIIEPKLLSKIFHSDKILNFSEIIDFNILGLTHTALNVNVLEGFENVDGIAAFDWWLFTTLLLNGAEGIFIKEAITYYRQTDSNTVGMMKDLDTDRLRFGIGVKMDHYGKVCEYCKLSQLSEGFEAYSKKYEEMKELETKLVNKKFMMDYIDIINHNFDQIFKGWWSEILTLNQWSKYAK